jgi:hypothetical protein
MARIAMNRMLKTGVISPVIVAFNTIVMSWIFIMAVMAWIMATALAVLLAFVSGMKFLCYADGDALGLAFGFPAMGNGRHCSRLAF